MTQETNTVIIQNILLGRITSPAWRKKVNGVYELQLQEAGSRALTTLEISDTDLFDLDPRLPEVISSMLDHATHNSISKKSVAMTTLSHWTRSNHTLEVLPSDDWYHQSKFGDTQPTWYIDSFKDIQRLPSKPDLLKVRMICYRVATTPSGHEFVVEKLPAHVIRPLDWLDSHFSMGKGLLDTIEALDLKLPLSSKYFQTHYLTTLGVHKEIGLPAEIDLTFG